MPARSPARKLKEMGGKVGICVNQEVGNVSLDLRCKGFAEGFGGKVTVLPVSNDPTEIRAQGQGALSADPAIDTDHGARRRHGRRAVGRGRRRSRQDRQVRVATFDLSADFLKSVARRRGGLRHRPAAISAGLSAGGRSWR